MTVTTQPTVYGRVRITQHYQWKYPFLHTECPFVNTIIIIHVFANHARKLNHDKILEHACTRSHMQRASLYLHYSGIVKKILGKYLHRQPFHGIKKSEESEWCVLVQANSGSVLSVD